MLRPRLRALGLLLGLFPIAALGVAGVAGAEALQRPPHAPAQSAGSPTGGQPGPVGPAAGPGSFPVGLRMLRLVDPTRSIRLIHGARTPRTLLTYVRYPALGAPGETDVANAPSDRAAGPFPLVVFAHGFAVTPRIYARLLQSWTRAGYVVAAPVFPLENANAPGGPDESDLINQPTDMSFVISRLLAGSADASDPLQGLIDPGRVALAGQSDGGETALAAAYSRRFRDGRIGAVLILSGAEMSGVGGFSFPPGSPPLLAAQGTADTVNQPKFSYAFFKAARRPKYLLRLLGARHLPPYTSQQPQLAIIERVTTAFLNGYLKRLPGVLPTLPALGSFPGRATLLTEP